MKTIHRVLLFFLLPLGLAPLVQAGERATIEGILISASNEAGQTDQRLAAYEPTLRRILRFESYRFLGNDSASLGIPEQGRMDIGAGHQLEVGMESSDGRTIHVKIRWIAYGRKLMETGLVLRPGVPVVLGGPSTGNKGEVYAVILTGR